MEKYRRDRRDLVTLEKFANKKIVVEVEVKSQNDTDCQFFADKLVCELKKKYHIKPKEQAI